MTMGRGLSELQRSILRLAWHNRTAEGLEHDRANDTIKDVYAWEVLGSFYGFDAGDRSGSGRGIRVPTFDKAEISPKRYESARVAVHKAFDRLVERGLATTNGGPSRSSPLGLTLTAEGIEVVAGRPTPIPPGGLRMEGLLPFAGV